MLYFFYMSLPLISQKKRIQNGFTLLELLVVLAMMGILASIVIVYAKESGEQGRDAKRQADIRALQSAIELYKNINGRYPASCRGADVWSGQEGTAYACPGGSTQYITGLSPKFIPVLPQEKRLNGTNSGYTYITNTNGTVYKVMAMNTVESSTVTYNHALKSCDIRPDSSGNLQNLGASGVDTSGWCTTATQAANEPAGSNTSYGALPNCRMAVDSGNGRFESSYGAWGGYEPEAAGASRAAQVRDTAVVICK
jgi:prepilin-type N-terminal cleavage/methylation domain-containing protein